MAEEIKKVVSIDVSKANSSLNGLTKSIDDSNKSFKSLKEAKQYIDSLTASMVTLDSSSEEYQKTAAEVRSVQDKLKQAITDSKNSNTAAEGSYNALSNQLKDLKAQWKATTDEVERNKLGEQMVQINDKLKNLDASVGVYNRNVGNYAGGFATALGSMKEGLAANVPAIGGVDKAFKGLLANPIGAVIAAVVIVLKTLIDQIKKSETQTNALKTAFAAFEPVINAVQNALSFLSGALVKGLVKAQEGMFKLIKLIRDGADKLGFKKLSAGLTEFLDASEKAQERSKAWQKLEQDERKFAETSAVEQRKISELREKAADKENYTAQQRLGFLNSAISIEKKLQKEEVGLANTRLRLMEEEAALTENSTEDNKALSEQRAKVNEVSAKYSDTIRGLAKAQQTLAAEVKKTNEEMANQQRVLAGQQSSTSVSVGIDTSGIKEPTVAVDESLQLINGTITNLRKKTVEEIIQEVEDAKNEFATLENAINGTSVNLSGLISGVISGDIDSVNAIIPELTANIGVLTENFSKFSEFSEMTTADQVSSIAEIASAALRATAAVLTSVADAKQKAIEQDVKNGKITEEEAKKEFENVKKMQIASAIIQGLAGAATAFATAFQLGPVAGPIVGAALASAVAATTAIQVAQIKKTQYGSSSSASVSSSALSNVSTGSLGTSTTGIDATNTTVKSSEATETKASDEQTIKVYVVESEIQAVSNRVRVTEQNNTF